MSQWAIQTNNLTRILGKVHAVDDLCLEIPSGIVFGFLGPNGAGKTTTIRLLLGLIEPTNGRAEVLGFDTLSASHNIRLRAGALLEHSGLYERLSAEDNLEFYGRVWRIPPRERKARNQELLQHLSLWERRKEHVRTWSRGMKQKLAVARTLLHRPDVIFLDEPTAGLDPVAAAALREDLISLVAREGVTVFLTTHNLSEAEKLCTKVGVINRGKLLALGHPDELRLEKSRSQVEITGKGFNQEVLAEIEGRPEVAKVEMQGEGLIIELTNDTNTAPLVALLVNQGVEIQEVRKGKASLEEAFLKLMKEDEEAA